MNFSTKPYPKGTRFGQWFIVKEKQRKKKAFSIRRWVVFPKRKDKRKYERLPLIQYKHYRDDRRELENFVIRLNNESPDLRLYIQRIAKAQEVFGSQFYFKRHWSEKWR